MTGLRAKRHSSAPYPPYSPPRIVRLAVRLLKGSRSFPRRLIRRRALRSAYLQGRANPLRELPEESPDGNLIAEGQQLLDAALTANEGKYHQSSYRVLMLRPGSITAEIWFDGLDSCMRHSGIECLTLGPASTAAEINETIERFEPNIVIATESRETLESLDLDFLLRYKRSRGCLRLFVPVWHSGMPGGYSSPRLDNWRWSLRRSGLTADAHFSIFEPELYERFARDPAGPDIDYITLAQACNPFKERPLPERKVYDYFMATSLTPERLEVTYDYVRPIMQRYRGLWAGPRWGFGRYRVPPDEMATYYARTRVALAPLAGFVPIYAAELTHRVYAAAGCGAFQLTMPTAITSRYFEPDELVQARSAAEYGRLFAHYVDRPDERNAVALKALRRVYKSHTCFHRIDQFVASWDAWRRRGLF